MISFAEKNKTFRPFTMELNELYNKYSVNVDKALGSGVSEKIALGRALISLWDSNSYSVKAEDCLDVFPGALITNCHQKVFFSVCENEFGLDKSQVSRLMNVVDEFCVGEKLIERYSSFKWSALVEILPLSYEERATIGPDWTVKMIREFKKSFEAVATSQQKKDEVLEDDWKEPSEFADLSRKELIQRIWKLNADRYRLYKIIQDNNLDVKMLESGDVDDFDFEAEYPAVDIDELLLGNEDEE